MKDEYLLEIRMEAEHQEWIKRNADRMYWAWKKQERKSNKATTLDKNKEIC